MHSLLADYLRLMRIPGIVGLAMTPVAGALSVNELSPWPLIFLLIIGVISKIYGFVMNDYFDVEVDKLSKDLSDRALVKGTISKQTALVIIIICWIVGYIAVFLFFFRNNPLFYIGLFCIVVSDILGIIYNIYGKQIIGSDVIIALSECMFFLFGAFMVLPYGTLGILTWILFILLFNEQFYMNAIAGGLKDADHDYLRGVKNITIASGVTVSKDKTLHIPFRFKAFGFGERLLSSIIVFAPFFIFGISYELWQIPVLLFFVILLLLFSMKMLTLKKFQRNTIRKLIAAQLLSWHFFIPIILFSIIGPWYTFLMIMVPLLWYGFVSFIIGQKLLQSQM